MSDHWRRIERGLRRIWTTVPPIQLSKSQTPSEIPRILCLLVVAYLAVLNPLIVTILILGAAWMLGQETP